MHLILSHTKTHSKIHTQYTQLWPYGKLETGELDTHPAVRMGKLGDNLVGVFGQDDVVVPTTKSGLIAHAQRNIDRFSSWPERSKKNRVCLCLSVCLF